jgi:predicted O-methyltransferase YrrM
MSLNDTINELLKEIELLNDTWSISRDTAEYIVNIIKQYQPMTILECGTSHGYSGLWIAREADYYGGKVHTVESFGPRYDYAKDIFERSGLHNITQYLGHCPEMFRQDFALSGIDLLFLDCSKRDYIEILETLEDRLSSKAIIIADNVLSHKQFGADQYSIYMQNNPRYSSTTVDIGAGLEVSYKL